MAKSFVKPVIFFSFVLALVLGFSSALTVLEHEQNVVTTYIIQLEKPASEVFNDDDLEKWYTSFLPTSLQTSDQMLKRMVHSYRNLFTGFAVKLTDVEAKALALVDGVVSLRRQQEFSLHTTHTPSFLGLRQNLGLWKDTNLGKGVIIGLLDTGIFPDHPSFSDEGMPPPPAKWKGSCDFNGTLCNNKLIGAKNFVKDNATVSSPIDEEGHGTHTSSTAAGNFVVDANVLGQAKGTAAGIAPLAHIAMYRVCGETCFESDILAAMDAAIGDGVDVLSLSLGGGSQPFYLDGIALGAFRAIQKGIFVSCSAGNSGPDYNSLSNEAPWILTVGASTVDRLVKATARLGNGAEYDGETLFQPASFNSSQLLPLVYPGSIGDSSIAFCANGSLRNASIAGKIVVCARGGGIGRIAKGQEVKDAGGVAMILMNNQPNGFSTLADAHVIPATSISFNAGLEILAYINSTSNPSATILFKGTIIGDPTAPAITSFSSRGPSIESPGILKPDITGPGVNILAAWPVSLDNSTTTKANFNIISGTSMSCPHLSGIAALLKSVHPNWSPAAIKSAIMTSADTLNLEKKSIIDETGLAADIFAVGSGHVNPSRAQNPGLVYDLTPEDYIPYLCGLGYSDKNIKTIVQTNVQCSNITTISEAQLNYPSFSVILGSNSQNYTRTVTNVGPVNSIYTYTLDALEGVDITVSPTELTFSETSQTATYTVTFIKSGTIGKQFSQGALTWTSGSFSVRSPIAVIFN